MDQITQAEMVEFLKAQKAASEGSKTLEELKGKLVARVKAGATQEPGSFKVEVNYPPYNTPAYKAALESVVKAVTKLNAVYTNGGGKPHLLNDKLPSIVEDKVKEAIPTNEDGTPKTSTKLEVKPNV